MLLAAELQHLCLAAQPVAHVATSCGALYFVDATTMDGTASADASEGVEERGSRQFKPRRRSTRRSSSDGRVIPQMVAFEHKDRVIHVGSVLIPRSSENSRAKKRSSNNNTKSKSNDTSRNSARSEDVAVGVVGRLTLPPPDELALRSRPPVLRTFAVTQLAWADAFSTAATTIRKGEMTKTRRLLLVVTTDGSIAAFEPELSSNCLALFGANSEVETKSGCGNDRPIAAIRVLSSPSPAVSSLERQIDYGCSAVHVAMLFYDSTLALCSLEVPAASDTATNASNITSSSTTLEAPKVCRSSLFASTWEQQPLQRWHDATTALDVVADSEKSASSSLVAVAGVGPGGGASTSVTVWQLRSSYVRSTGNSNNSGGSGSDLTLLRHVVLLPQLSAGLSTPSLSRDNVAANAAVSKLATTASAEFEELAALDQCFIPPPLEGEFEESLASRRGAAESNSVGSGGGLGAWRSTAVARLSRGAVVACPPIGIAWSLTSRFDEDDCGDGANNIVGGRDAVNSIRNLAVVDARGRVRLLRYVPSGSTQAMKNGGGGTTSSDPTHAAVVVLELVHDLAPGDSIGENPPSSSNASNNSAVASSSPAPPLGLEGRRWAVAWWSGATSRSRRKAHRGQANTAAAASSNPSMLVVASSLGRVTVATTAEGSNGLQVLVSAQLPNLLGFSVGNINSSNGSSLGSRSNRRLRVVDENAASLLWTVQPHASGRSGGGSLGWLRAQETMAAITASVKRSDFTKALLLCRTIGSSSRAGMPSRTSLEDNDGSRGRLRGIAEERSISADLLTAAVHRARWRALLCPRNKNEEQSRSQDQIENPFEGSTSSSSGNVRLGVTENEIGDTLGSLLFVLTSGKVGRLPPNAVGSNSSDSSSGDSHATHASGSSSNNRNSGTANASATTSGSSGGGANLEVAPGCLWVAWQAWMHCGKVGSIAAAAHLLSTGLTAVDHVGFILAAPATDSTATPASSQGSSEAPSAADRLHDASGSSSRSEFYEKWLLEAAVLRRGLQLRARQWDTSNRAASVWGSALVPPILDVYGVPLRDLSTLNTYSSDIAGSCRSDGGSRVVREGEFLPHSRATDRIALALFRSMIESPKELLTNDAHNRNSIGNESSSNIDNSKSGALAAARLCAVHGASRALQVVLIRHPAVTLPHRLDLLALLPETVPPSAVAHLLPAAGPTHEPLCRSVPRKTETAASDDAQLATLQTTLADESRTSAVVPNLADGSKEAIEKARSYFHYQAGAVVLLPAEWAEEQAFVSRLAKSATTSAPDVNSSSSGHSSNSTSDAWSAAVISRHGGLTAAITTCQAQRATAPPTNTKHTGDMQPLGSLGHYDHEFISGFGFDSLGHALLEHEHRSSTCSLTNSSSNDEAVTRGDALAWYSRLREQQADPEQLAQWFLVRAAAMDRVGGQAMHAAELLALAWPRITAACSQQTRKTAALSPQRARKDNQEALARRVQVDKNSTVAAAHDDSTNSQLSSGSENEDEPSHGHDVEGAVEVGPDDESQKEALTDIEVYQGNEDEVVDDNEGEIREGKWVSLLRQADASAGCFVRLLEADCLPPLLELRTWWSMPAVAKLEPVFASLANAGTRALAECDHFQDGPNNNINYDDASKAWDEEVEDVLTLLVGKKITRIFQSLILRVICRACIPISYAFCLRPFISF